MQSQRITEIADETDTHKRLWHREEGPWQSAQHRFSMLCVRANRVITNRLPICERFYFSSLGFSFWPPALC
jgi:hypothetical protein